MQPKILRALIPGATKALRAQIGDVLALFGEPALIIRRKCCDHRPPLRRWRTLQRGIGRR